MTNHPIRVLAVDWSGDAKAGQNRIWIAEVVERRMVRLEDGRDREEVIDHLLAEASRDPHIIVGLDFAFSFPEWFCREMGASSAREIWKTVAERGEEWLARCPSPFWGRPGKPRPDLPAEFRRTEERHRNRGVAPKSVFQIGGGGAVGTGSLRGMPHLLTLMANGFGIFPFTPSTLPLVLEIYPRALTGPVNKSSRTQRLDYLRDAFPEMPEPDRRTAAGSEDAFDAAVSALVMARHLEEILQLDPDTTDGSCLEGEIWSPERPRDPT